METRPQSRAEELANALTHGVGAFLGAVALVAMVRQVLAGSGDALALGAVIAYGLSLVVLFGASALYHAVREPRLKRILRSVDHCAIYFLIAGTYTPFALVSLEGFSGWSLFFGLWTLAAVGIAFELIAKTRLERLSLTIYLIMGWAGILVAGPLISALAPAAVVLIGLGGLLYTSGILFYTRDQPWDHAVWHGFVLGGASLHGVAIVGFVV